MRHLRVKGEVSQIKSNHVTSRQTESTHVKLTSNSRHVTSRQMLPTATNPIPDPDLDSDPDLNPDATPTPDAPKGSAARKTDEAHCCSSTTSHKPSDASTTCQKGTTGTDNQRDHIESALERAFERVLEKVDAIHLLGSVPYICMHMYMHRGSRVDAGLTDILITCCQCVGRQVRRGRNPPSLEMRVSER